MTIATTTTKVAYTGNGAITQWAVNFPITAREDVKAIVTTPQGADTALQYGVDYSVSPTLPPGIGATMTTSQPVASGSKLTIYLSTPITQPTDYENSGFLDLEQAEKSYDRLTLICQQLAEALGRAIKTGITSAQSPDQLLAFITQTAGQVATDAAAVATAMGNLFRYPIAQFTTTPGVLDYALTHPADPTSNNVFLVMGGLPQQPGVDFTLPNATTIRFTSNPGTQVVWGFITLSQSNPDISAQVQASVAAGIAQIQAFLDTQLAPTGQLGIAAGGTGASTAAGARTSLGFTEGFRSIMAGIIVEWESETIPILDDAKPLGLELNGDVVSLTTFANLLRKWCGSAKNATAPAWYRCTAAGVRDAAGSYIKLQDRRGEFARGWDHGRGVDTGRVLGSAQGDAIRNITGSISASNTANYSFTWAESPILLSGAFAGANTFNTEGVTGTSQGTVAQPKDINFDASRMVPTASENRPRSIATMYIVLV